MKKLEDLISTYKNFPKKGINFKDVLEIVQEPEVFHELILKMSSSQILEKSEAIISIDARGFIFGSAIALKSSKPMIVARKPGKLPGEILTEKYNSYAIVDDLLATGGTVECVANILKKYDKKILGLLTVVELVTLKGRNKFNFPVESSISF